jgi:hypothetical protein
LLVNLAKLHDWSFAVFSLENLPLEQHMAAIAEKYTGKPFHNGARQRMSAPELEAAMQWTNEHFAWIMPNNEDDWTIEKILAAVSQLCLRRGIRGLVIDPWNELEALRPSGMTETEFNLAIIKAHSCFCAQPRCARLGCGPSVQVVPKRRRQVSGAYSLRLLRLCALAQQGGQWRGCLARVV